MKDIAIVSKAGGNSNNLPWGDIQVSNSSSVIKIPVSPNDISSITRSGQNLVITTRSGETITLQGYFNTTADGAPHDLVFEDSNGKLWQAEYVPATSSYAYKEISSISELLLLASTSEASGAGWLWPLLGAVGVGAAISESGGGNEPFVRLIKPLAPTNVSINEEGTQIVGRGEPGSTVIVRGANGNVLGQANVGPNGEFQVVLQPPQHNGESITVVIRNPQGQESDPVAIKAPTGESEEEPGEEEETTPDAPTDLLINAGGTTLTGRGEPGTQVEVRDPAGNIIGTGTVAADGTFTVALQPPQTNGQTLSVTLTNSEDNTSPAATINAPTITDGDAPDAPTNLSVNANGTALTGRGEPGTQVQVRDPAGNVIGSGTVAADGSFTVTLQPPQTDGETLSVTLTNSNNQTSPAATTSAPDIDSEAPDAPTNLTVNASGTVLTGRGEPGTQVEVRGPGGNIIGTGTVAANGAFTVNLLPPQSNGQLLSVTLTDSSNQTSLPGTVNAPVDTGGGDVAPNAPTNLAVNTSGTSLSGRGQPGTQVRVQDADGQIIGTATVLANGTFTVVLSPAQTDGQLLSVTLTNTGNGLTSAARTVSAPDIDPGEQIPDAATNLVINPTGTTLTGIGQPGAQVEVRNAAGTLVGSGTVQPNGTFIINFTPPQTDGGSLSVVLSNGAGDSPSANVNAPKIPDGATDLAVSSDGSTLTGEGEPGATVIVRNSGGTQVGTGAVNSNGTFAIVLTPPQTQGETLSVVLRNDTGDSQAVNVTAPVVDPTGDAPDAPENVAVSPNGRTVTGEGEPGATVIITNSSNQEVGRGIVAGDGSFTVTLNPPQTSGDTLSVVLSNGVGESPAVNVQAPTVVTQDEPDAATNLVINATGNVLNGRGESGAHVEVRNSGGTLVGSGTVQGNGAFFIALSPAQVDGGNLSVVLSNFAGNSPAANINAPKAPDLATDLIVSADGTTLTGEGDPGSVVTVRNAANVQVGTGTVNPDGTFTITLTPPQTDGGTLSVVLSNATGDSPTGTVVAPVVGSGDEPDAATSLLINPTGTTLTGEGEVGATVEVRDAGGSLVGSGTVQPDGSFSIAISPAQINGGTLSVVLTNSSGSSPASTITAPKAPDQATDLAVSLDGSTLSGEGEPGASIVVRNAANVQVGSGTVNPNGTFGIVLSPSQIDGGQLSVVLSNLTGSSPVANVNAPVVDTSGPVPDAADNLAITPDGTTITGEGQPGATVIVTDAADNEVGRGVVTPEGDFTVTLNPPQTSGGTLTVVLSNGAGDSPAETITAPKAPDEAQNLAISSDGATVTGEGEEGATVEIRNADGQLVGSGNVQPGGTFSITLTPPQTDGGNLSVVLSNTTGASPVASITAPDIDTGGDEPDAATNLAINASGNVLTGNGEASATIEVRNAGGTLVGSGTVQPDGSFILAINPAQTDGNLLSVVLTNGVGSSPAATITAPKAPDQATDLEVSLDGSTLSGEGEPGATIVVRNAANTSVGTGIVNPNGTFAIVLSPAQIDGGQLSVVLSNLTGSSPVANVNAPVVDTSGPVPDAADNLAITPDGTTITGEGQPGATVIVTDAANNEVGRGVVTPVGDFTVTLIPPQTNGGTLTVVLSNGAGDSPAETIAAPKAPDAATNIQISATGETVTGEGEEGAAVEVLDAGGQVVGTGTVQPDGTFSVTLTPPQTDGGTLSVVLSNATGESAPVTITAPQAPDTPTDLEISPDGLTLTGAGLAGASVTVRDSTNNIVGSGTVQPDGSFSISILPAQVTGDLLSVVLTNSVGSSPAATITAPKAPDQATDLAVSLDGSTISGEGEPGATIVVRNAANLQVGSGTVNPNGTFAIALTPSQIDGGQLSVVLSNATGSSPVANVNAPVVDTSGPVPDAADNLAITPDGTTITGEGQPGATVIVTDVADNEVGRGVVTSAGDFTVTLNPPQTDGGNLTVVLSNGAGDSPAETITAPKVPDEAQNVSITPDGQTVTGTGEEGATVEVRNQAGDVVGSVLVPVGGAFSVPLNPPQTDGGELSVVLINPAGESPAATVTAPLVENDEPDAPTNLVVDATGTVLTGQGEVGAAVTVENALGQVVGSGTVQPDGTFTVNLIPAQTDGGLLSVVLSNANGDSDPSSINAAKVPDAATDLMVGSDGSTLGGLGEAGASVNVYNAAGQNVGSGTVNPDGTFGVSLVPPQTAGGVLTVILSNPAGSSPGASIDAPEVDGTGTPPATPINLAITSDGTTLTGEGEAGATVRVLNGGVEVGWGVVLGNGTFSITLDPAQTHGGNLSVILRNAAGDSPTGSVTAPKVPDAATDLEVAPDGLTLTGSGEPSAIIDVRNAANQVVGNGIVQPDGSFTIALSPAQVNGGTLQVVLSNTTGSSPVATTIAPKAPDAATELEVSPDGLTMTGEGLANATVEVRNAGGDLVGSGSVLPDGSFSVTLTPAQTNGGVLTVTLSNPAGNSPAATTLAPNVPDAATNLEVSPDGATLTGQGEAGTIIVVRNVANQIVGSGTVPPGGSFSISLTPPQTDGEALSVTLSNATGDSPIATTVAPEAPEAATNLQVSADGWTLSGEGEAGATIEVRNAADVIVGTGTVQSDGTFLVGLTAVQTDGGELSVVLSNPAGSSAEAYIFAPKAPDAATALTVEANGLSLTGSGEPAATITVRNAANQIVGTGTVQPDGSFMIALSPAQVNGGTLQVVLSNATGSSPAATTIAPRAPDAATDLEVSPDGLTLTGEGQEGAAIEVLNVAGDIVGTGTVQSGGIISIALSPAQTDGGLLRVTLSNPAGSSPTVTTLAPKAPDAAVDLEVSPDGATLTGQGEAGTDIVVRDAANQIVGSGVVPPGGSFSIPLTPAQTDGGTLTVVLSNATGDSPDATTIAPQAPDQATGLVVSSDGSTLWGDGEPGATVAVTDLNGTIGSGVVNPNGTFSLTLTPPQTNGELISVTLSNPAGSSPVATVNAPVVDNTGPAPDAPENLLVSITGTTLLGQGEPGAVVVVTNSSNIEIGRGVVAPSGNFNVTLSPPQTSGDTLSAVLTNAAGTSPAETVVAPQTPEAATNIAIAPNGLTLTGEGDEGTIVTVRNAGGQIVGSGTVPPGGNFSVTLSPAQIDGGTLSVVLSNGTGNSPAVTLVAPRVPDAATDVEVNATGTTLIGEGEIGASVQVLNAANQVVGVGTVQPDGSFSIPLTPTQNQGGTLSVVLSNSAGNSAAVTLPAPKVPDAATNVVVAPNGAILTGEGEAGANVEVRNAANQVVGSGQVQPNGTFTITFGTAQNQGGTLSVILSNPAGNSAAVTLTAPKVPDAPTDLEITPNGVTLTGEGEVGATVQVRNASNQVVGNGTVQANGTFTIILTPPQTTGGALSVVLSNAAGSSAATGITAPVVEPIDAFDNLVSAHINLNPTVTSGINAGSASYVAFLNLLDILELQVLTIPTINFTVAHGHQSDMRLTYGSLLDLSLLGDVRVVVQVKNASGQWVALEGGSGQATLLELSLLSGGAKGVQLNGLPVGEYRAFVGANGALGVGLLGSLNGTRTDYDYTQILGSSAVAVSGNVITDAGIGNQIDDVTANTIVARVNTTDIPTGGMTISGTYGTLTIQQNGSYTYTPNNVTANIGKVDTFTYLIRDTLTGVQDSAKLHVRIESNGVNLVWDAPANNATSGLVAVNDTATAQLSYKNVVTDPPIVTLGSFNATGVLGLVAPSGNGTANFVVPGNQVANVSFVASVTGLGGVLPNFTITVEKNVNGSWVQQGTGSGIGLLNLLGLGATGFALQLNNLTTGDYRVKVSSNALLGVGNYKVDIRADALITHLNQYEVDSNPGVTGNILAGDSLGSVATKLLINVGGNYTEVTGAGLTVTGTYGTLVIQHNGSYVYTPNVMHNNAHHTADVIETFTYRLQHPSGEIATATLRITIDVSGAGVASTSPFSAFVAGDDIPELDLDLAREDSANIFAASENDPGVTLEELIDEPEEEISLAFVSEEPTADLADASSANPVEPLASDPLLTEPVAQNDDLWNQPENQLG